MNAHSPALQKALNAIEAMHDHHAREARKAQKARIRRLAAQFTNDRDGLIEYLNEGYRHPLHFTSLGPARARLPLMLHNEMKLARSGNWKARPYLIPHVYERLVLVRYFQRADAQFCAVINRLLREARAAA